jgi:hypothetical protein
MGQTSQPVQHQATTLPVDARFEIFQSESAPILTLKLDRITGNVDQLVSAKAGNWVWEKMRVLPHPKAVVATKPHFEIFVADSPTQAILLLDTESGATWQLISNEKSNVWQPIE